MKLRLILAALLCVTSLAPTHGGAQATTGTLRLTQLTRARVAADFAADREALDTLLSTDLTYVRSSGVIDDKAAVLAQVGPGGPYQLDYLTPDSLVARLYGSVGVVTGILRVKLSAQSTPYSIRFTDVWSNDRGRWQLVAFQATRVP
ncbi:MAG: nuclear transport factor 2 family protein [Gemmatimonadetes bacterium]|nr:nuclear transport factor 2 family protein [Gemmatimonadota bacterium]MCC6771846.1 nuclear transport factor 2 family protein [Gemmatimonadaceae bacterium]